MTICRSQKGITGHAQLDQETFSLTIKSAILGRAHARTTDAAKIAGYCGKSAVLDDALTLWAEIYGNQTVLDHAALVKAVKSDRLVQALIGT